MNKTSVEELYIDKIGFIFLINKFPMNKEDYTTRLVYKIPHNELKMKAFMNLESAAIYVSNLSYRLGITPSQTIKSFQLFQMKDPSVEYRVSDIKTQTAYSFGVLVSEDNVSTIENERLDNYTGSYIKVIDESLVK